MTTQQQDELKAIYHKVMIGAVTLLIALIGWIGRDMVSKIDEMNTKLGTVVEQVIKNQKDIEFLKEGANRIK